MFSRQHADAQTENREPDLQSPPARDRLQWWGSVFAAFVIGAVLSRVEPEARAWIEHAFANMSGNADPKGAGESSIGVVGIPTLRISGRGRIINGDMCYNARTAHAEQA